MPDPERQTDYHHLNLYEKSDTLRDAPEVYERTVSTKKKSLALLGYFICNIGLTVYNKATLGKFNHPWLLTSIHTASSSVGCALLLWLGRFHTTKLTVKENFILLGFSLLFTINIAVSNMSLAMVSIPFHQVVRATTPLFTILIYRLVYSRTFPTATYLTLIPIILGVPIATYGDLTYTHAGFAMTFLGVILAALKSIITNRMLTGRLALSPLEILFRMSPLACIQSIFIASLQGELDLPLGSSNSIPLAKLWSSTYRTSSQTIPARKLALILLGNGLLAFILNVSSFKTNKLAGALTMTVCANIKQCLTIVLGISLFDTVVTRVNLLGIVVTLIGGMMYSIVELKGK